MAVPLMCCAADIFSVPSRKQIVVVGRKDSQEFEKMLVTTHAEYEPNKTVRNCIRMERAFLLVSSCVYSS